MALLLLQSRSGLLWWHSGSLTPFCNIPDFGRQEAYDAEQSDLSYNNTLFLDYESGNFS